MSTLFLTVYRNLPVYFISIRCLRKYFGNLLPLRHRCCESQGSRKKEKRDAASIPHSAGVNTEMAEAGDQRSEISK